MNQVATGGATMITSLQSNDSTFQKGLSILSKGAFYQFNKDQAREQFQYAMNTMRGNHKAILGFFTLEDQEYVKMAKERTLDSIKTSTSFYVPMIVKPFDLEEANSYDKLTNEKVREILDKKRVDGGEVVDKMRLHEVHTNKYNYDEKSQVKIRLIHNDNV